MKRIIPLLLLALAITGCNQIDEPVKPAVLSCGDCSASEADPFITQQNVLIEEFTGITCNNCPNAVGEIKDLQSQYPERVFSIGIHASNFAVPNPPKYPDDFRTESGTEIYNYANPVGVPSGMVNRRDYGQSDFAKLYFSWSGEVDDILQRGQASIGILPEVVTSGDTVCLTARFKALEDLTGKDLRWCAFLTENGIIAPQKMPDNSQNKNYEHIHVLRATLNGTFGSPLAAGNFIGNKNEVACETRSIVLKEEWVAENCEIIVYVYEDGDNSQEVQQVVAKHL
ncbi:MAG: Omp28 family outer membrane lipoprotein [Owenweeksia sp.]|nr:Omp28 family outer membrane lipoprotein [Owenweeksia sp.]